MTLQASGGRPTSRSLPKNSRCTYLTNRTIHDRHQPYVQLVFQTGRCARHNRLTINTTDTYPRHTKQTRIIYMYNNNIVHNSSTQSETFHKVDITHDGWMRRKMKKGRSFSSVKAPSPLYTLPPTNHPLPNNQQIPV